MDCDGNLYHSVAIGTQVWLAENLKTTRYNDYTCIPLQKDAYTCTSRTPGYCWFNNDEATYKNPYGALYKWYTVNTGKLCPTGWHVPSDAEWDLLVNYSGGADIAGGKLKEAGEAHWCDQTEATNETGFTALPGGSRTSGICFSYIGVCGEWWTSTEPNGDPEGDAHSYWMIYNSNKVYKNGPAEFYIGGSMTNGYSVRCVKD
jgi:uncharacterized protein (TIGR02145 family)